LICIRFLCYFQDSKAPFIRQSEKRGFCVIVFYSAKKAKLPFLTLYIKVDAIDSKIKEIEANSGTAGLKVNIKFTLY